MAEAKKTEQYLFTKPNDQVTQAAFYRVRVAYSEQGEISRLSKICGQSPTSCDAETGRPPG
jgi:hypothetical protein